MARQFAKRYADKGIVSIAVNPGMMLPLLHMQTVIDRACTAGNIKTELQRYVPAMRRRIMARRSSSNLRIRYSQLTRF